MPNVHLARIAAPWLVLSLAAPAVALADDRGQIEIGVGGGVLITDALEDIGPGGTGHVRVGYTIRPGGSLELDVGFALGKTKEFSLPYTAVLPKLQFRGLFLQDQPINLFLTAGVGAFYRNLKDEQGVLDDLYANPDVDLLISGGPGIRVPLTYNLSLRTEYKFLLNIGSESNSRRIGDNFLDWEWSAGVAFAFGGKRDSDRDGIADEDDGCIDEAEDKDGFQDLDGCPEADNDQDGIVDELDACPDEAEDIDDFEDDDGCSEPDNDKDGIEDMRDQCRNEFGTVGAAGCPDRDGDDVADKFDLCPDSIGLKGLRGCPDKDEDGMADIEDLCPDEKGSLKAGGCPDKDDDRIADMRDECPDVAAPEDADPARSTGCLTDVYISGDHIVIKGGLEFARAIYLASGSKPKLDELAKLMKLFEDVKLDLVAWKDEKSNSVETARKRGVAVQKYLADKGVPADRVSVRTMDEAKGGLLEMKVVLPQPVEPEAPLPEEKAPEKAPE